MFTNNYKPGTVILSMVVAAAVVIAANEIYSFVTKDLKAPIDHAKEKLRVKLSSIIAPDKEW